MSLFNLTRLHNKIVLITGASAGIGKVWLRRPLSQHLHAHRSHYRLPLFSLQRIVLTHEDISFSLDLTPIQAGSNIVLVARRPDALKETVAACEAAHKASGVQAGGKVHTIDTQFNSSSYPLSQFTSVQVDVSKKDQVSRPSDPGRGAHHPTLRYLTSGTSSPRSSAPSISSSTTLALCLFLTLYCSCSVTNAIYRLGVERVGEIAETDIEAMFATNVHGLIAMTQLLVKGKKILPLISRYLTIHFQTSKRATLVMSSISAACVSYESAAFTLNDRFCQRLPAASHMLADPSTVQPSMRMCHHICMRLQLSHCSVRAFTGSLMRELVDTPIRVTEIQPGMVETGEHNSSFLTRLSAHICIQSSPSYASVATRPQQTRSTKAWNLVSFPVANSISRPNFI